MNETRISCPVCGHRFDPLGHRACQACPLQDGCSLACCPACGHQTIDESQSRWAQLAARWLTKTSPPAQPSPLLSLIDVPPGCRAKLADFSKSIPSERQAHLLAYGLVPGHWIKVLQHSPVTVVVVDHTEVALEEDLACKIKVQEMESVGLN